MNRFTTIILSLFILCYPAFATTLAGRVQELEAAPGVGSGNAVADMSTIQQVPLLTGWEWVRVTYARISGDVVQQNTIIVAVKNRNTGTEEAYYFPNKPDVLNTETKFMTDRTVSGWGSLTAAQQLSAIKTFCNGVYKSVNAGADDIREFSCQAVSGSIIKVSGWFDKGTTWAFDTWYVRLIDPNGSVAAPYANVEFQEVTVSP